MDDVQTVVSLGTPHLSTYQLTIEPGTRFGALAERGEEVSVNEGLLASMYNGVEATAHQLGLSHYEISNAARPGFESKHNLGYWFGRSYMGLGPSAHGLYASDDAMVRYSNCGGMDTYLKSFECADPLVPLTASEERLDADSFAEDLLLTGLRLKSGIKPTESMTRTYLEKVADLTDAGLMKIVDKRWMTTPKGRVVLDYVLRRLLL